jgi:glucosamine--fructose-6-phosphate aminotransferase (isomerizing)
VIVVAPSGAVHEDIRYLVEELVERGGELLVISDSQGILDYAKIAFPLPQEVPEWLSPLVAVIPGQLFGMALAQAKGLDPDQPSGITKVTETK